MHLSEQDRRLIWHPYTQAKTADPVIPILSAKGSILYAEDGREYLDMISSWWVNLHGHSHPYIAQKVFEQFNTLEHVIFSGFTHKPALELASRLQKYLPTGISRFFFSDNGSTAVEVALKMCMQFWQNKGEERSIVLALEGAYHGDTFGAMSVSERGLFTRPFKDHLFDIETLPLPDEENFDAVLSRLKSHISSGKLGCIIVEALVQGAGGMNMYRAEHLDEIFRLCREAGVLIIADEVMTGFYRTGRFLACDYLSVQPDIVCLSKGITGGTMALGLTVASETIYEAFYSNDTSKTLYHGHSYTANPIACAAALASLDLLEQKETLTRISAIVEKHSNFCKILEGFSCIENIRQRGTIIAFNLKVAAGAGYLSEVRNRAYRYFLSKGLLIRPLGNVIYLMPPYCVNDAELDFSYQQIISFLKEYEKD